MKRTIRKLSTAALAGTCLLVATGVQAAVVNASYEGVITQDSGLGLLGQTLRADLSYDDAITGTPSGNSYLYQDLLLSLNVSVGASTWIYDVTNGFDAQFLYDDDVLVFVNGVEDRVNLSASTFSGPDLGTGSVSPFTYTFELQLQDNVPSGTPDGLAADDSLPGSPLDAALFSLSPGPSANSLAFGWVAGNPEFGGIRYEISTSQVASVSAVPLPGAVWLLGTAVLGASALRMTRRADSASRRPQSGATGVADHQGRP